MKSFVTVITVLEVKNGAIDINRIDKKYAKEALHRMLNHISFGTWPVYVCQII